MQAQAAYQPTETIGVTGGLAADCKLLRRQRQPIAPAPRYHFLEVREERGFDLRRAVAGVFHQPAKIVPL